MQAIARVLSRVVTRSPLIASFVGVAFAAALAVFVPPVNAQGTHVNKPAIPSIAAAATNVAY